MADGGVATGVGRDAAGPTGDEGDAMPALEEVGLVAASAVAGVVAQTAQGVPIGGGREAVVGGEDDEGVGGEAGAVQLGEELAECVVELEHEIAVGIGLGPALIGRRGKDGRVWGRQREVEEEGLAVGGRGALPDEVTGGVEEVALDGVVAEVGGDGPGAPELQAGAVGDGAVGGRGHASVHEVDVGRHVQGGTDAVEAVEAVVQGAACEGTGVVHVHLVGGAAGPIEPKVPLADHGGGVAGVMEEAGQGDAAGLDQRGVVAVEDIGLETASPCVAAGEEGVAAGRAHAGGRVGVREHASLACEAVDGRRAPLAAGVQGGDVADAHVVREDEEDVGGRGGSEGEGGDGP